MGVAGVDGAVSVGSLQRTGGVVSMGACGEWAERWIEGVGFGALDWRGVAVALVRGVEGCII